MLAGAAIVVAANAGGAWSPIGDVTSLLLWLNGKIGASQMVTASFLPTLTLLAVTGTWLYSKLDTLNTETRDIEESTEKIELSASEKLVIASALSAFILPLAANLIGVQPYTARLFGLGVTWVIIEFVRGKSRKPRESHVSANIDRIIQSIDISSIMYLTGILLAVGALTSLGVLAYFSHVALGAHPSNEHLIVLSTGMGLLSAAVDNSALVAMAIRVFPTHDPHIWALIGITTGTAGSLTIFGSAAGIVAMGSLKNLTFLRYFKLATLPVLVGMFSAVGVWLLQYHFLWHM